MSGSLPCFSHISASHDVGPLRITLLILLCRSINTLMPSNLMTLAQGQAQGRQAGSGKRQRRRVDIVRPSTANTKVWLPIAVVIAKVSPTIAVAKTKVRPDTATMRTLGGCRHGKRRKDSG